MRAIMADNDILGQMNALMFVLESEAWREFWLALGLPVRTFADLGLSSDVSDAELWHVCQREQIVLVTGNRNKDGPDSLETTIQTFNTSKSLPVFTLSDTNKVMISSDYAHQVVNRMLDYLMDIDNLRGTGRLWLP